MNADERAGAAFAFAAVEVIRSGGWDRFRMTGSIFSSTFDVPPLTDTDGDVLITGHNWNPETGRYESITIDRADPRAWITAEMLNMAVASELDFCTLNGDVLTLRADNRTVIYRIRGYHVQYDAYLMEWPD